MQKITIGLKGKDFGEGENNMTEDNRYGTPLSQVMEEAQEAVIGFGRNKPDSKYEIVRPLILSVGTVKTVGMVLRRVEKAASDGLLEKDSLRAKLASKFPFIPKGYPDALEEKIGLSIVDVAILKRLPLFYEAAMGEVSRDEIEVIAKCTGEIREKYKGLLRAERGEDVWSSARKSVQRMAKKTGIRYNFRNGR